jgi:hypothetical protein
MDLANYKGMYFDDKDETANKHDPVTGAHFIYADILHRIKKAAAGRNRSVQDRLNSVDALNGISSGGSEMEDSSVK